MAHSVKLNLLYSTTASRPRSSSSSSLASNAITLFSPIPSLSLLSSPPSPKLSLRTSHFPSIKAFSTTIAEPEGIKVSLSLSLSIYMFFYLHFGFWGFLICVCEFLQINSIATKPIEGQKTGTSGLRKKVFSYCSFY